MLPAGAAAAGLILFLIRGSVHSIVLDDLRRSATALAKSAAQDAEPGFRDRSEALLLPQLQDLQKRQGALYAAALDSRGVVLAHTTISEKGSLQEDPFTRAALKSDVPVANALMLHGEPVLEVAVPVWSDAKAFDEDDFLLSGEPQAGLKTRLGILKVGVPMRPAQETQRRIVRNVFLIVIMIGGVALGLVLFLIRGILGPVTGLMDGISRIGRGRYDVNVPILSRDELGDLARSFNAMSAELSRTTVSKEYVEGIIENMADPLVVADPEGAIETTNHAALETLDCAATELVGRPFTALFDDDPAALLREIADLRTSGAIRDREVALKAKSGRRIPAIFSASILKDRQGRSRGYVCVAKDITERKKAEDALLAAKISAEASSKELEAFSYSVSHDLRAPLRGIAGFSQIILEDSAAGLDDEGKENLNRVVAGTKLMGSLIDDILELSRVSRTEMRRARADLSEMAKSVVKDLRERDPSRRLEVRLPEELHANGDPNLLRIVLV
ncbi:MAG TPA: PAS domain S-box protein, partial [Elusimicrobiota bacterium]|nr:PAS domain S-box protein [Elusimicrobiota bacterium]